MEDFKDYMVFRENVWESSVANRVELKAGP